MFGDFPPPVGGAAVNNKQEEKAKGHILTCPTPCCVDTVSVENKRSSRMSCSLLISLFQAMSNWAEEKNWLEVACSECYKSTKIKKSARTNTSLYNQYQVMSCSLCVCWFSGFLPLRKRYSSSASLS